MKNIIKCVGVAPLVCLISICCVVQEFADISIFVLGLDMSLLASALLIIRSARLVPSLTSRVFSTGGPLSSLPSPSDEPLSSPDPKPFSDIPGRKGWPLLGNLPWFVKGIKNQDGGDDHIFHKLHSQLGPIYKLKMLGNNWIVVTSDPEAAKSVMRAEGKYPSRGIFEKNVTWIYRKINFPPPMFIAGGEEWKKIRSAGSKQVIPRRVGNFVGPLSDIADGLLSHLESIKDESGNVHDIRPQLNKWAFQGISYFVYGEKIDVYSERDPVQKEFIEAGIDYIESVSTITSAPPLYKLFPTKPYRDYVRIVKRIQAAGKPILDRRYNEIREAIVSGHVDETKAVGLLDQWLIEGKYTEKEALSQSYDMLSAGIDTTANSTCFLLYEIAKQPELQERLIKEISSVVGDKKHPSWDDLQKITLVRNCVKEVMRLYVPTGGFPRVIAEDAVLLGYHVPAGTTVIFNTNTTSKDENIFRNPRKFDPDRWSKDASEEIHPFSSLPFGFGPRSCYGRRLAELEMYLLLSKMLPKYRLSTAVSDVKLRLKVVLKPKLPLHIKLDQRL